MSGDLSGCFESGPLVLRDAALFTDLYEITMAASYFREGMREPATFQHVSLRKVDVTFGASCTGANSGTTLANCPH